jgi:hypothetical protein
MTALIVVILTVAGFCGGAYLGGRAGRRMMQHSKWTPLAVAFIILAGMGVIAVITGGEVSDPVRAVLASVLGYAGGLVVVSRENFYR